MANITILEPQAQSNMLEAKARKSWYLYDFANSIIVINGSLYFPQWIVGQGNQVGDLAFNLVFVFSSIFTIFLSPLLGFQADKNNTTLRDLVRHSVCLIAASMILGLSTLIPNRDIRIVVALISFFCVLASYQFSLVFYNSLLSSISNENNDMQRSGIGLASGWLGGIFAIFFGLLFSKGYLPSIGNGGMATIVPSTILTAILSFIALRGMRHLKISSSVLPQKDILSNRDIFASLVKIPGVLTFLIAYFLFSDAILTIQNNSTIFMEKIFHFSDDQKAYIFLLLLITGAIGALIAPWLNKMWGLKKSLIFILFGWFFITIATGITNDATSFVILFSIMGLLNGAIWNTSRVMFLRLIGKTLHNTAFGIYSTFERFSSIVGPLIWSAAIAFPGGGYKVAWLCMGFLLGVAVIFYTIKTKNMRY